MFDTKKKGEFHFPGTIILEQMYDGFSVQDNLLIRPDGVVTAFISVSLKEEEQDDEEGMMSLIQSLASIVKTLPGGTTLHFQKASNFSTTFLESENDGYFLRNLKTHFSDRPAMRKKLTLYLSFDFKNKNGKNSALSWLRSHNRVQNDNSKKQIQKSSENINKANNLLKGFLTQVNSLEKLKNQNQKALPFIQLGENEIWGSLYEYYNLSFLSKKASERVSSSYRDEGNLILIGEKKLTFVSLHEVGTSIFTSKNNERLVNDYMSTPLERIPFPNIINTCIFIPDKDEALKKLDNKNKIKKQFGNLTGQGGTVEVEQGENFTKGLRESGDILVSMEQNVMVWAVGDTQLEEAINFTKSAFNLMNNSLSLVTTTDALAFFTTFAPGNARDMFYGNLMTAQQALCFVNFSGPTSSENDGVLFGNRAGEPVYIDLFSDFLENKNALLIGPSGSGKSVTGQYWIVQNYDKGYDQTIIDIGGSYINVVELLGGKYFRHSEENPIQLNPFNLPKDGDGLYFMENEKLIFLTALLSVLWKDNTKAEVLSKNEEAIISEFLNAYVVFINKNHEIPRLDKFYTFVGVYCQDTTNARLQSDLRLIDMNSFMLVLRRYCDPASRYYKILNADETEDISKYPLVAFDMAGVQNDPLVYPFMSLIIIDLVFNKFTKLPLKQRKYLYMDEAWSFMGHSPQLAGFMESMFRTCRKMNAGAVVITQSVTELQTSKVGVPIRNNTAIKILLDHRTQTSQMDTIEEFLGFNKNKIQKIKSIRATDTKRELFMDRGGLGQVLMVDTGPHLMAAFSTKPDDKDEIRKLIKRFGNAEMAINYYVENKAKK